jgi:hypothetical protein
MPDGTTQRPDFLEAAKAIVLSQQARRDRHVGGVCWSGMTTEVEAVESIEVIIERLAANHAKALAFRASPRGRFLQCVEALEEVGAYNIEADRLRGFYNRSITVLNGPTLTAEGLVAVAECVSILNGIVGRDARAGIEALSELLRDEAPLLARAA